MYIAFYKAVSLQWSEIFRLKTCQIFLDILQKLKVMEAAYETRLLVCISP